MKKNLKYEILADCMDMNKEGVMEYREQVVVFRKGGISHIARIITYVDIKERKVAEVGIVAYQRLRHATANHSCHISQEVANRVTLQTDQAEFPS